MAARKGTEEKVPAKNSPGKKPQSVQTQAGKPGAAPQGRGKKPPSGGANSKTSRAALFWLAFAIFIFGLFLFNWEAISASVRSVRNSAAASGEAGGAPEDPGEETQAPPSRPEPPSAPASGETDVPETAVSPEAAVPQTPANAAPAGSAAQNDPEPAAPNAPPAAGTEHEAAPEAARKPANPPAASPALRDRALYFIHVDKGGDVIGVKANRRLPASDSPMLDALTAVIEGPNGDEKTRELISLIPKNTRILSATVRDRTAYLSFSEDFQYNSYGVEGYAGQLRQIVFTATEFSNVKDVQILIEGRRVDYLGEGIWIGSPLGRDTL